MKKIDDILQEIEYSISSNEYIWTKQETVAIKDNGHVAGEWKDLFVSVNAFLNTKGGYVIIGIEDDELNNQYVFKGFDNRNESKIKLLSFAYTDKEGETLDLSDYIYYELKDFLNGQVLVVYIDELRDDLKYAFYKEQAWERLVSGDARIPKQRLATPHEETQAEEIETINSTPATEPAVSQPITEAPEFTNEQPNTEPLTVTPAPVQKSYSADLITIFGTDYISLDPDFKQMLAYIYEQNHVNDQYPGIADIGKSIWLLRQEIHLPVSFETHQKTIKKMIALLEKSRFINRRNGKQEYAINKNYTVTATLFN